jgi:hypothetical protein
VGVLTAALLALPALASAGASATPRAPYGEFTIAGAQVSGAVTLSASSCNASKSAPELQFIWFGGLKTLKGVSPKSIFTIEVNLKGSAYGRAGTLKNDNFKPPFITITSTTPEVGWQSISGHFMTSANGASGSVTATLAANLGSAKGHTKLTGTWQRCKPAADS